MQQFEAIGKIADKYSGGNPFYYKAGYSVSRVELEDTLKIMRDVLKLGINTLGAGGNTS